MTTTTLTSIDYDALQQEKTEINMRMDELQDKLDAMEARELADSTSDAFFQLKREQGNLRERLDYIQDQLANADVVDKSDVGTQSVGVGNRVKVHHIEADDLYTFDVVSTVVADTDSTRITASSPMGEAIIGKQEGDKVIVKSQARNQTYRIIDITLIPS